MSGQVVGPHPEPVHLIGDQTGVQTACRILVRIIVECRSFPHVSPARVDVGIDDDPAVFGRRQIGAGRGLQLVAEQGGVVVLGDLPADVDLRGSGSMGWGGIGHPPQTRHRPGVAASMGPRAYRTRRHRVARRERSLLATARTRYMRACPGAVGGVAHEIQLGECTGRRAETRSVSLPASLAAIVRISRSDVAELKLEPRHQALKLWDEIVDPGDRDRRAVRPGPP